MSAATLMNSGTVTKKPATKLRRSHCICRTAIMKIATHSNGDPERVALQPAARRATLSGSPVHRREDRDAEHDPVPRKRREAVAADVVQERPHDERRRDEREHEANG